MGEVTKSSKEILTELFDSFDVDPPSSPSESVSSPKSNTRVESADKKHYKKKKEKKSKKEKKAKNGDASKRKKKKKKKRKKQKGKSSGSESDSDSQVPDKLKKNKSRKRRKRSHSESSDSSQQPTKISKKESDKQMTAMDVLSAELTTECSTLLTNKPEQSDFSKHNGNAELKIVEGSSESIPALQENNTFKAPEPDSMKAPKIIVETKIEKKTSDNPPLKVADVFVEDLLASGDKDTVVSLTNHIDKPKTAIKITDLKKSSVLEAAEAQAKLKAEKYEEGEISDSSRQSSHSLSDANNKIKPPSNEETDIKEIVKVSEKEKKKHKHSKHHKSDRSKSPEKDSKKSSAHKHSHSRSRDSSKSRRDRNRSKDQKSRRSGSKDKEKQQPQQHRVRSRSKEEKRRGSVDRRKDERRRGRSRDRPYRKSKSPRRHSRRRHSHSSSRKRTRSRSRSRVELSIDKNKLLEIARKNALNMIKQGTVGTDLNKMAAITAGGKTVDELTDFCKLLAQKDATGQESISSGSCHSSESESEKPFHHPFLIKDRPNSIVMNIRNCVAIPVKTHQEKTAEHAQQLRLQFPVSSGQQHRKTENDWVPVSPKRSEKPLVQVNQLSLDDKKNTGENSNSQTQSLPNSLLPPPPPLPEPPSVFCDNPQKNIDIGEIVTQRLTAMRKLQDDPNDPLANEELQDVQNKMKMWAESKSQPGLFTGTTGVRILSQAELASGQQAWVKKDQLITAQPVCGGMGMSLLQKMGWKPGEGLGKRNEGTLEPLKLPVKMDKRGLVCAEELPKRPLIQGKRMGPTSKPSNTTRTFEGKHPVSLLVEFCTKRHYGPPSFTVCFEDGPSHKKSFLFKVTVNGIEYKGTTPSPNKKQAKSEAASVCLRAMGVLPV